MTVLVLYGSRHVGARLIHRLSELRNVTMVTGSHRTDESIQLIAELNPGIVIVDAQIGDGAGIEVVRKLKCLSSPPFVIMTASSPYTQYRQECMRSGADFYFQLPGDIEQISNVVYELTDRSSVDDG